MFWFKDKNGEACSLKINAYNSAINDWYVKEFLNVKEFLQYLQSQFKETPDQYKLKNTKKWKESGQHYTDTVSKPNFEGGKYHSFVEGSVKYNKWYDTEEDRIINGVIYDDIYVPPFYYWYLNYCPIYDDVLQRKRFADVWDGDLWYMQYCMLCILQGKHIGGVKGRQKGYSFKHMAILYWSYSWFENSVNTIGAFDEKLVLKSWRFLGFYRKHLNSNTEWRRGPQIPKALEWNEVQLDENNNPVGLGSILKGVTFKQSPFNDVGGSQTFFNYEEPGVSPTLLETLEAQRPALEKGSITTGFIIACGSVGALDDAQGLKTIFYNPKDYNFLPLKNVWDIKNPTKECCIFISEAYNMIGTDDLTGESFMDSDGNSNVELAMKWIERKQEELKQGGKKSDLKQLALSQKCTSPEQAFAQRTTSRFPLQRITKRQEYLETLGDESSEKPKRVELFEDDKGQVRFKFIDKEDAKYPVKPSSPFEDREGVVLLHKIPEENPKMYTYFAGVDNIEVDQTTTSESLFSLYIVEGTTQVIYWDEEGNKKMKIEGDNIVASVTGRLNTVDATNERALLLIRLFNAFTLCEKNKPNFITYTKKKGYGHLLAAESDVPIFKDLTLDYLKNDAKGIQMDSTGKKQKISDDFLIEWLNSEIDSIKIKDSKTEEVREIIRYKTESINDYWLLEELKHEKENTDRRDAIRLAILLKAIWQANSFKTTRVEESKNKKEDKKQAIVRTINFTAGSLYQRKVKQRPIRF